MKSELAPMFEFTERTIMHEGRYPVQVEIPYGSSLTGSDIERLLRISSWESDSMDDMADAYEGGRGVKFTKGSRSYNMGIQLDAVYVSGVGYRMMSKIDGVRAIANVDKKMHPPSGDNFYEKFDVRDGTMSSTDVIDGLLFHERPSYAPIGSYTESRAKEKILKTIEAGKLPLRSFAVPKVEAYGRYLELEGNGENLAFIAFPVPSLKDRLGTALVQEYNGSFENYCNFLGRVADIIGKGASELHGSGRCHRQLHFDNIYYDPDWEGKAKAYVMDWGTMMNLDGVDHIRRMIDLRGPWQGFENLQKAIYGAIDKNDLVGTVAVSFKSVEFVQRMLGSYFNGDVDFIGICTELIHQGVNDDRWMLAEAIRRNIDHAQ